METRLKELEEGLKQVPALSDKEEEQITKVFEGLTVILEDTLAVILALNREEAYRYTELFVSGFMTISANYIGDMKAPKNDPKEHRALRPTQKPDFKSFVDALEPRLRAIIEKLDCYKNFINEEIGEAVVCDDCGLEKMLNCIRVEDPTIDPNEDFKIDLALERKRDKTESE